MTPSHCYEAKRNMGLSPPLLLSGYGLLWVESSSELSPCCLVPCIFFTEGINAFCLLPLEVNIDI